MITKKDLADHGFTTIKEYQDMIFESVVNGQLKQASDQFRAMSNEQRVKYLTELADFTFNSDDYQVLKVCISAIY
jgi:hypothetical protein